MHAEDIFVNAKANKMLRLENKDSFSVALGRDVKQPEPKLVKIKLGWYALKHQVCSGSNPLALLCTLCLQI